MPVIAFNEKTLDAKLRKKHATRVEYTDTVMPGLCLRIGPGGAAWFYRYKIGDQKHRQKLGDHDAIAREAAACVPPIASFTLARAKAAKVVDNLVNGRHPKTEQARERAEAREAVSRDEERIVRHIAEQWAAVHLPKLAASSRKDYRRALDEFLIRFGGHDIGAIRRGVLKTYLDEIATRSGAAGNRMAVVIRLLLAYARDRFDWDSSPAAELENPAEQTKRERTLDRDEIRVLWRACELAGYPYGHCLRLALCFGQRMGEVGGWRRSEIDSTGDFWKQRKNKSNRRTDLWVDDYALEILRDCPNFGPDAPFFSASVNRATGQPRPLRSDTLHNAIRRYVTPKLKAAAEELGLPEITERWVPHDLRRTVRTGLTGWCGVTPDTAERVLNHAMGGLRAIYDHSDYRPQVADALNRWDNELHAILQGLPPTGVTRPVRRSEREAVAHAA